MTFLPIVDRELRVAGRHVSTYRNRVLAPGILAGVIIFRALLAGMTRSPVIGGAGIFHAFTWLALVFCALEGVRKTADCISEERREGTLGLLFLTSLNGYDVILGKLAAASLGSIFSLLAALPVLAWSLIWGGVTMGEVARASIALGSVLFFSLAGGIWVSSRSRVASHAMAGTICLLLAFLMAPVMVTAIPIAPLSPVFALMTAPDADYGTNPIGFWGSVFVSQIIGWVLITRATATVNRFRDDESTVHIGARESWQRLQTQAGDEPQRLNLRTKLLGINPIYWLASRNFQPRRWLWVLVFAVGLAVLMRIFLYKFDFLLPPMFGSRLGRMNFSILVFAVAFLVNLLVKVQLAAQATRCLAEARRNSTLEVLLCSPLKISEILHGQVLALRRAFLKPIVALMLFEAVGLFWVLYDQRSPAAVRASMMEFPNTVLFAEVAFMAFFLLDFQGVAWAGIWFGLCSRNESRATFKTVFFVIVLPLCMLMLYCFGFALFVLWPIASFVWARLKLQEQFRTLAGSRAMAKADPEGWIPFEIPRMPDEEPLTEQT